MSVKLVSLVPLCRIKTKKSIESMESTLSSPK